MDKGTMDKGSDEGEDKDKDKGSDKGKDKDEDNTKSEKKQRFLIPDIEAQQNGLIAAFTAMMYQDEKDLIAKAVSVSVATVHKYLNMLKMPGNQNSVKLVKTNGRPLLHPLEVGIMFIEWALDPTVPLNKKTMGYLIVKYMELSLDYSPEMKSKVLIS